MTFKLSIYKYKRFMIVFLLIVMTLAILIGQHIIFDNMMKNNKSDRLANTNYSFDELKSDKNVKNIQSKTVDKVISNKIPENVIAIGNNIKFIGYIKGGNKVFVLVEYDGIEYNLKVGGKIKTNGADSIMFKEVKGNYALFEINKYIYRMSIQEKQPEIPFIAD